MLVVTQLALVVLAFGYTTTRPVRFAASTSVYVNRVSEPRNTNYFTYDGYYAGLAAKEYTDVVSEILKSADMHTLTNQTTNIFTVNVETEKLSPQLLQVRAVGAEKQAVETYLNALVDTTNAKVKSLTTSNQNAGMELLRLNPATTAFEVRPNLLLNTLISLTIGAILVGLYILLREYFKS